MTNNYQLLIFHGSISEQFDQIHHLICQLHSNHEFSQTHPLVRHNFSRYLTLLEILKTLVHFLYKDREFLLAINSIILISLYAKVLSITIVYLSTPDTICHFM